MWRILLAYLSLSESICGGADHSRRVLKQMKSMPKADQARNIAALERVARDPTARMPLVTEMVGEPDVWRLRKGNWRATFVIEGADVVVTRVGNRREVYR
jgi:mRNA-degrading endonuclease RelE of RelBE toxin-antitoxin system